MAERRRLLVIFNPTPGPRARRRLNAALRELGALGAQVTLRETRAPGDAEIFASEASLAEFDAVVAVGGDGTVNEVVNGLRDPALPVIVFPFGTANVLAHEIALPRDPALLAALAMQGPMREIPLGEAEFAGEPPRRRRFVLMAGTGFDADVVDALDLDMKRRVGRLAFVWSILRRLWGYRPTRYEVALEERDGWTQAIAASAVATRARHYAGRFVLAPEARLAEPSFRIVRFGRWGRWAALRYLVALAGSFLHRLPDVAITETVAARISGPEGSPVQIDGDVLGRLPVTLRIADRRLRLIYPGARPTLRVAARATPQEAPVPAEKPRKSAGLRRITNM